MSQVLQICSFPLITAVFCISANAVPIEEIEIGTIGGNYNGTTHRYQTSGDPFGGATVRYDDSSSTLFADASFKLNTLAMAASISLDGLSISYIGSGSIVLREADLDEFDAVPGALLLSANLTSLSMQLTGGGLYTGTGQFSVTGGSLASDFGATGGVGTFGLSTRGGGTDFNHDFGGFVNVFLSAALPGTPGTNVPDGGLTLSLLGMGLLSISAGYRKFVRR